MHTNAMMSDRARTPVATRKGGARETGKPDPERARRLLACLGDPSRFRVIVALGAGERCVTDLASDIGLSQSCTSRHLQALLGHRLVCRRRDGKRVLFSVSADETLVRELIGLALATTGVAADENPVRPNGPAPRAPRGSRPRRPPSETAKARAHATPPPRLLPEKDAEPPSVHAPEEPAVELENDPVTDLGHPDMEDYLL